MPIFKNDSFKSENESRIIFIKKDIAEIKFRNGKYCFIPYYPLNFASEKSYLPFKSIRIGPNIDFINAEKGLDGLLSKNIRSHNYMIEISKTKIPYRI